MPSPDGTVVLLLGVGALRSQPDKCVLTGHRTFSKGPNSLRMAQEIAQLGHRQIDRDTVNVGKRVEGSTTPFVLPREGRLGNFNRAGEGGKGGQQRGWRRPR